MNGSNDECDALQAQFDDLESQIAELRRFLPTAPDKAKVQEDIRTLQNQARDVGRQLARCRPAHPSQNSNLTITAVEYTQGIQFFRPEVSVASPTACSGRKDVQPQNDIKLVAEKGTVLRAYIDVTNLPGLPAITNLSGVLETQQVGSATWDLPLTPYNAPVTPHRAVNINRAVSDDTLNFRIPQARCRGPLNIRITAFDSSHPGDPGYTSSSISRVLQFIDMPPLKIRLIRIRYENATRMLRAAAPSVGDFWTTAQFLLKTYPIPRIDLVADSEELYDGDFSGFFDSPPGAIGSTGSIFTIIDRLIMAEGRGDDVKYYALIPAGVNQSGASGWGVAPSRAAANVFQGAVMAQEIGHTCNRFHAPCGNPPGPDPCYPTYGSLPSGSIGEFGFDVITSDTLDPANTFDFMSYCGPAWVSPYTYEGLMNYFQTGTGGYGLHVGVFVADKRELLYLLLQLRRDGSVTLREHGFHLEGFEQPPSGNPTPFCVELNSEKRQSVEARRVYLPDVHKTIDDAVLDFVIAIPWRSEAESVVIKREDKVLRTIPISKTVPRVTVTSPEGGKILAGPQQVRWMAEAGGGRLKYVLRYSNDNGATWLAIATNITENEYTVDLDKLSGGEKCAFQVLASEGIRTGAAITENFIVVRKPDQAFIFSPETGANVIRGEALMLFGAISSVDGRSGDSRTLKSLLK